MFEVGDLIKGKADAPYGITNENITKGVVKEVTDNEILVRILKHKFGEIGCFWVAPRCFEKIGHMEKFDLVMFRRIMKEDKEKAVEYLREVDLKKANLSGANLSGADFSGADFSGADLSEADFSGADLSEADFSGANLSEANLSGADLSEADLSGANLSEANLSGADLSKADFSGADLSKAYLRRANLYEANLSEVKGLLDAIDYLKDNFEKTEDGYIVYKTFNSNYCAPDCWKIETGEVITEVCNPDRTCDCGCGINVAPYQWIKQQKSGDIYKLLIRYEWLPGVIVPFNTDGKIRCSRAQILGVVA